MKLQEKFKSYNAGATSEAEWEKIINHPDVVKYNQKRLLRRICLYSIPSIVLVGAVITAVVLSHPANKAAKNEVPVPTVTTVDNSNIEQPATATATNVANVPSSSSAEVPSAKVEAPVSTNVSSPVESTVALPNPASSTSSSLTPSVTATQNVVSASKVASAKDNQPKATTSNSKATANTPKESIASTSPKSTNLPEEPQEELSQNTFYIPSAFTPNGDGLNDLFFAQANFEPHHFEMAIYSRKGEMVFMSKDIKIGWDGTRHGSLLPSDVYTYIITYIDADGKKQNRRGQVTLIK